MAKNTGRGSRVAAGLIAPTSSGIWGYRPTDTRGKFIDAKTFGGTFTGATRTPKRNAR